MGKYNSQLYTKNAKLGHSAQSVERALTSIGKCSSDICCTCLYVDPLGIHYFSKKEVVGRRVEGIIL